MFELTESLMFQFVFQSKMTFNQFCGKYGVCPHHLTSIVQNTAADHLGSPPTSYVLELTGFHQGIFKVLYSIRAKECKITMCNTDNLWIRNTMASSWQLTRCQVITVGYIIDFWLGPSDHICSIISQTSGQAPVTIYMQYYIIEFWLGPSDHIYAVLYHRILVRPQ